MGSDVYAERDIEQLDPVTVDDLASFEQALCDLGYRHHPHDESVTFQVIDGFPAVATLSDDKLHITCQVMPMVEVRDSALYLNLLAGNLIIRPYAFAVTDDAIVLVDSLQIGDLSVDEVEASLLSLRAALMLAHDTLKEYHV